jgi:hypothetical protein
VNRDSGTDSANGGWLRRLVRHYIWIAFGKHIIIKNIKSSYSTRHIIAKPANIGITTANHLFKPYFQRKKLHAGQRQSKDSPIILAGNLGQAANMRQTAESFRTISARNVA